MSTQLKALLESSRKDFEIAKETLLNETAKFLIENKDSVIDLDHFLFSIKITIDLEKTKGPDYYYVSFASLPYGTMPAKAHQKSQNSIYTPFNPDAIEKVFKEDYKASVLRSTEANSTYLTVTLPFA